MAMKNKKEKGFWLPRVVLFLGFVVIALISFAIFKENYRKRQIQQEISSLQKEMERIQKDNVNLSDKLAYLGSSDYQEKEAKDKLNMQRPGEAAVVIQPEQVKTKEVAGAEVNRQEIIVKISNPEKWLDYFFKY